MQAIADRTMSDTLVACNNCPDLYNQLDETRQRIAQFTRSGLCQNAYYREQLIQQDQKYEIILKDIAADKVLRQKIYDGQSIRLNDEIKEQQIVKQSLAHEFKCHRYTEKLLRDAQKALVYEQERNTKLLAIVQQHHFHHPLTASELDTMMKEHLQPFIDALQHTLKGLEGEGEDLRGNRELDVE